LETGNRGGQRQSRWDRIPTVLKAIAGLIGAVATLLTAIVAVRELIPSPAPTPSLTPEPEARAASEEPGNKTLTPTATPTNTPTRTPTATPTPTPSATPTLPSFDAFDDGCIDPLRWRPIPPVEGSPPDEVDETNCWTLSPIHRFREIASKLEFRASGQSSDGLQRIKKSCTFTDLELIVSRFALDAIYEDRNASGYVGMVIDRPDVDSPSVTSVGVWLSGRLTQNAEFPTLLTIANQEIQGIPDMPTQQLLARMPSAESIDQIALGFHIIDRQAFGSVNGRLFRLSGIEMASPFSFRIVFGTTSGSSLFSAIEEVRISWDQSRIASPDCPLP
jgi:hypothetical protein